MSTQFYTKAESDALIEKYRNQVTSFSDGVKTLSTTDPTPTTVGWYKPTVLGTYANAGNLVVQSGYDTLFYRDEVGNWSKVEVELSSIIDGSVSVEKTTFAMEVFIYGKNRFDKTTITQGFYVNSVWGTLSASPSYVASDWVFVGDLKGQNITFSPQLIHVAFYTEKNETSYISGMEHGGETIQVPFTANWLRCSVYNNTTIDAYQIEAGSTATGYEAYKIPKSGIIIPNLVLPQSQSTEKPFPKILLPSVYYLAQGIEYNFYFKAFFVAPFADNLENYYKSVFAYRGKFMENKFVVSPNDDFNMLFKIENIEKAITKKVNCYTALQNNGNGVNRKVLVIGDSTINNGGISKRVSDFFAADVMDVTLLGTRQSMGVNHEGRSGWTMQNYIESGNISGVANPFFDGSTFNFSNYLSTTGQTMGANDWVFIQLGINDLYPIALQDGSQTPTAIETKLNAVKARLQLVIDSIKAHNSNIRVGIIQTFPPAISQDATGNLLQSSFYSLENYFKKGIAKWWEILLQDYDTEAKRNEKIYLIGANAIIDRENDFATALQNIDQYDTTQVERQVDDVHPYDGYNQVGDIYIGAIKYFA